MCKMSSREKKRDIFGKESEKTFKNFRPEHQEEREKKKNLYIFILKASWYSRYIMYVLALKY